MANPVNYRRVLLKLSGEALMGELDFGIDSNILNRVAGEIRQVTEMGVEVGIVIGGGNIFRGAGLVASGIDRVAGDHMGMLATVMNSLAMQDAIAKQGVDCRVMSAVNIDRMCENYDKQQAMRHLQAGRVVIFAAGTGNPYFTTDTAGCLRAIEIEADSVFKATKVNGVYDSDPMSNPDAVRFESLTYDDVLERNLQVMDATAVVLCRDNNMPLRIFNLNDEGALSACISDGSIGTTVVMS